jgi:hypothetical protein
VRGLETSYTVFVIDLQSRRVQVVGSTRHPDEAFVVQATRHLTDGVENVLGPDRVLICDRDPKWSGAVVGSLNGRASGLCKHLSGRPTATPLSCASSDRYGVSASIT